MTPDSDSRYAFTSEGIPIRQGPGLFRPEEEDEFERSYDVTVKVFDLAKTEDLEEYRQVLEGIANRKLVALGKLREPEWSTDSNSYHVLMRWGKRFAEVPRHLRRCLMGSVRK